MIIPRQDGIVEELRKRIARGDYPEKLPGGNALAQEFGVNVKTMNKALARLVRIGLVERRRRFGTAVRRREPDSTLRTVEIIYNGIDSAFSHPFWSPIFSGAVRVLEQAGFHPVLNPVGRTRSQTEKLETYRPLTCCGRIVLGIHDIRFADRLKREPEPFVFAGDSIQGRGIPQVVLSSCKAAQKTISLMCERGFAKFAFLGDMQLFEDSGMHNKFIVWRDAVRKYMPVDPDLVIHTSPASGEGAAAVKELLTRTVPDAIFVGFGTLLPEVENVLREAKLAVPVISFDGALLPGYAGPPQPIVLPLAECGETAARNLLAAVSTGKMPPDVHFEAVCIPEAVPARPKAGGMR
ncbi:MAG: GntR family transcriptional regulator [Lentisphaeria bacterium]|nr:GntR family transcriptional regulator [Lentisphaeria bacterium]